MTKTQFKQKIKSMLKDDKSFIEALVNKVVSNMPSDIKEAEDNFRFPKNALTAIYREMSRQYAPFEKDKTQVKLIDKIYRNI